MNFRARHWWLIYIFGRPFLKRFALSYRTAVCPVCLSVSLLYCSQTVGWIKMKLGMRVGLGPGHIVLDGDLAPLPKKGAQPPIFGSCLLWPNGWVDQDGTWHGGCLGSGHIVLDGHSAPLPKKGAQPPIFGPCLLWQNSWMDQDATWYDGRPRPRRHCVRCRPSSPLSKGAQPPIFGPCLLWPNGRPSQLLLSTCMKLR